MTTADARKACILIASDKIGDASLVKEMLDDEFDNIHITVVADQAVADFERLMPVVMVLGFDTLEKAERYALSLYRLSRKISLHPHRTIILCNRGDLKQTYTLCRSGSFDDYMLFWPMTNDTLRLPMSVHSALGELSRRRESGPSTVEFAALARQLAEMETLLASSLAQGDARLETTGRAVSEAQHRIGAVFDGLTDRLARGELSDMVDVKNADRLSHELRRIKNQEIAPPLESVAKSIPPLSQWTKDLKLGMQPHRESARSLAALAERVKPVVLVVDDDEFQRSLIRSLLEEQHYSTVMAASGLEALQALRQTRVDLVLMDVMMAGMDGLQTTMEIKAAPHFALLPVIMVTGNSDGNIVRDSLKAGAVDFIVKPVKPGALLAKINRALRPPSHGGPQFAERPPPLIPRR